MNFCNSVIVKGG